MTTFLVMQTRIVDDLVRDDLANQIRNAVNDAIELQEGERYSFNERRYRILTVADQEYYDLTGPTLLTSASAAVGAGETILELDDITATVSNRPYRLSPRTQQHINEWQDSNYRGQPADYSLYNRQLRIFPVPDGVYPLDLNALARLGPNPLTADGDTNAWMTDGASLTRAQAEILLYRDVIRDPEGVSTAQGLLAEAQAALKRKMAAQAYTGRQKAWDL